MNKSFSFGAILVLACMVLALSVSGFVSMSGPRFERPDRFAASIAGYNRMVEREQFLASVRDRFLKLRDQRLEWNLTKSPGETIQRSRRRLDQAF